MMQEKLLIKNATIINEGMIFQSDVLIAEGIIQKVASQICDRAADTINAAGLYLFPGVIDPHVHFREPGLTHKADIQTESASAIAGGVTSFMDMPNTLPHTTNRSALDKKYQLATGRSYANFGFYCGVTSDNTSEIIALAANDCCALTDDGLYFTNKESLLVEQPELLRSVLNTSSKMVAIHSEYEWMVNRNLALAIARHKGHIPVWMHAQIRSEEACYMATQAAIEIAGTTSGKLHILHVSTAKELELFEHAADIRQKKVTSEVCIHHLYFSEQDYEILGSRIKWNPSVKTYKDKECLINGLRNNLIDIVATDHAPHLLSEKEQHYSQSPGGGPMVQHSLVAMLELAKTQKIPLERIAEVMCHNVAELYKVSGRGYIREGYHADITLVNPNDKWQVTKSNILSKCGWSPFEGWWFSSKIKYTIVNGHVSYSNGHIVGNPCGARLEH